MTENKNHHQSPLELEQNTSEIFFDKTGHVESLERALEVPLAVKIRKQIVRGISEYNMIQEGDKIMVAVSGGKDSSILVTLLHDIQRRAKKEFSVEAVMLDQKQPGFDSLAYEKWMKSMGVKLTVLEKDTYSIVQEKVQGKVYCSLCSRLRRGILYNYAQEQGFTKIALGHHRDDMIETLLLNIFYTGKLSTMPPKLRSDDRRNIVIRPMVFVGEEELKNLTKIWNFPIIPCNLCGSQEGLKRQKMKDLVNQLEKEIPMIRASLLTAMGNVRPSQLMDSKIWDFANLETSELEPTDGEPDSDDFLMGL